MQIAEFLEVSSREILEESITYARSIEVLKDEDEKVLRNHLPKILQAISSDLRRGQSRTEALDKSHGKIVFASSTEATAAETHGLARARSGLNIDQVVAEYRALRACVLRLFADRIPTGPDSTRDIGRFNEAIDQALAESVRMYSQEVDRWQQIFLGVLGHELRGPLHAITLTTEMLVFQAPPALSKSVASLTRSARRMASLMDSLLEYNKATLNGGMVIKRGPVDLAAACRDEIEVQLAAMPKAQIALETQGSSHGEFDVSRIREALANLLSNAVKHGVPNEPVQVRLVGDKKTVTVTVENAAAEDIPASEIAQLFEPLRRGALNRSSRGREHLGLGLFIVRQIVKVHGGEVFGRSAGKRVMFTITLPKFELQESAT